MSPARAGGRHYRRRSRSCLSLKWILGPGKSVYNYNRRSALIDDILRKLFSLVSFQFYDDKFGFELEETVGSALDCARAVHIWLGARFDEKKVLIERVVDILGVTYDLVDYVLKIKTGRQQDLLEEFGMILEAGRLEPGHAGKLKDKL